LCFISVVGGLEATLTLQKTSYADQKASCFFGETALYYKKAETQQNTCLLVGWRQS